MGVCCKIVAKGRIEEVGEDVQCSSGQRRSKK